MKRMDHAAYQKALRSKSSAALRFILRDASEAARLGQELGNPNVGYYLDEVNYAGMELARRKEA